MYCINVKVLQYYNNNIYMHASDESDICKTTASTGQYFEAHKAIVVMLRVGRRWGIPYSTSIFPEFQGAACYVDICHVGTLLSHKTKVQARLGIVLQRKERKHELSEDLKQGETDGQFYTKLICCRFFYIF